MSELLKEIFSSIMKITQSSISDNSSPDNIEIWDSLRHIHLVSALEEKFDVEFTDKEIDEMHNFRLIEIILRDKLSN